MEELDELERDIDYLIAELRRLGRRTGVPALIPPKLVGLAVQVQYILHRKDYQSDYAIIHKLMDEFCLSLERATVYIFGPYMDTNAYFILETEGDKEPDFFLPDDAKAELPDYPEIKGKKYSACSRYELIQVINYLTKRLIKLERVVYKTINKSMMYRYLMEAVNHPIKEESDE
jgi:hypothetical protein